MEIIEYTFEEEHIKKYLSLLITLYKSSPLLKIHINKIQHLINENNPFFDNAKIKNFLVIENKEVLGHISAIDDKRLDCGLIGFFDCVNDKRVSSKLLDLAVWEFKDKKRVFGPVNLSIWHNYRFVSKSTKDIQFFDPLNKEYYIKLWKEYGFKESEKFISATREDFDFVTHPTKKAYEEVIKQGFRIRTFNIKEFDNELNILLDLSNKIFQKSRNIVSLSLAEFNYLYSGLRKTINPRYIEIVEDKQGNAAAFCFTLPNPLNKNQIILKTIGVLPEYQRKHIGAALLHSQHTKAKEDGFKEFYYPLIRVGNNIGNLPYDGYEIITEYLTFEKSI